MHTWLDCLAVGIWLVVFTLLGLAVARKVER